MENEDFTKYETARILGARALQLSMNAPILIKLSKEELKELDYDSIRIAEKELNEDVLPIAVKRPMPKKLETELKKAKIVEKTEKQEVKEEKIIEKKAQEEVEEIKEEGEIMELATPEDEVEEGPIKQEV